MKYERLTDKDWHITKLSNSIKEDTRRMLKRLWDLENKIEQGTLIEATSAEKETTICDGYHTETELYYIYDMFTGKPSPMKTEVGVCWGTKERDRCECGGDRKKCDFYETVRNG